jgi:hypothetical protein
VNACPAGSPGRVAPVIAPERTGGADPVHPVNQGGTAEEPPFVPDGGGLFRYGPGLEGSRIVPEEAG